MREGVGGVERFDVSHVEFINNFVYVFDLVFFEL